jgi:hypothetical protein
VENLVTAIGDVKDLCGQMKVEYSIIDSSMKRLCSSDGFDAADRENGHTSVSLDLASGSFTLMLANTNEGVCDIAFLFAELAGSRHSARKKLSADELFARIVTGGSGISDEELKELKIRPGSKWMTAYVKYKKKPEADIKDILTSSLPKKVMVAGYSSSGDSTTLLMEIPYGTQFRDMVQYMEGLYQMLETEFGESINIGIGSEADSLADAGISAERAKKAAFFGRLPAGSDGVYLYGDLGPARIVSNISDENRASILEEALGTLDTQLLDNELQKTIDVYFRNNMNISETARSLYIHRNTLIYRMEKIQKLTGLDLNDFDDAVFLRMILLLKAIPEGKDEK